MTPLFRHTRRFLRDDKGSISVESVIILPVLLWIWLATFVFFDAYRANSVNLKAAYTIADALSREFAPVNDIYIDNMRVMLGRLNEPNRVTDMRITQIGYDEDTDRYQKVWSEARGSVQPYTDLQVRQLRNQLPIMPDREQITLVETWTEYDPLFGDFALEDFTMSTFIFTRPRYNSEICFEQSSSYQICQPGD